MKKKTVVIHQPNFIPWLGFFDKVSKADVYIVFGSVLCDWRNQSVLNRNKIKTPTGPQWLTVPIHADIKTKIKDVKIDYDRDWPKEHLKTLFFNYKKTKNFSSVYTAMEKIYSQKYPKLIDLNLATIKLFMKVLKIKTKIVYDADLKPKGQKNDLLIDLIKKVKGNVYLSGLGAKNYMDVAKFKKAGIKVVWQDFKPSKYKQLWGEFTPNLSALDYLFCDGRPFSKR